MDMKAFAQDPALDSRQMRSAMSQELLCVLDTDLRLRGMSPAFQAAMGHSRRALLATPITEFIHRDDTVRLLLAIQKLVADREAARFQCRFLHADGSYRTLYWTATMNGSRKVCVWVRDDTPSRRFTDSEDDPGASSGPIRAVPVLRDRLTGLPNRELLIDRVQQAIRRAKRGIDHHFAVLFIDFSYRDAVHDAQRGRDAQLLRDIAQRLTQCLRVSDTVSTRPLDNLPTRFVGDEFLVLLDAVHGEDAARATAERLCKKLSEPYVLAGHTVYCTASIGWVMGNGQFQSPHDLIHCADEAMYQARDKGGGCVMYKPAGPTSVGAGE